MFRIRKSQERSRRSDRRYRVLTGLTAASLLIATTVGVAAQTAGAADTATSSTTTTTSTTVVAPAMPVTAVYGNSMSSTNGTGSEGMIGAGFFATALPNVDYAVLGDPRLDYFSIRRAEAYGLTMDQITTAYALAHESGQTLPTVLDKIEDGATFSSLAQQWGVPMQDVYSPDKYRAKIDDFITAYQCTGNGALHDSRWQRDHNIAAISDNPAINGTGASGIVTSPADITSSSTTTSTTTTSPALMPTSSQAITDVVHNDGRFTQLSSAITAAGLDAYLRNNGPYTLFAPTDAAFAKLPSAELSALLANPTQLSQVLQYHLVGQNLNQGELMSMASPTLTSIQGATLNVATASGATTVNGANVLQAGIPASNGTIYPIDTVLIPSGVDLTGSALSSPSSTSSTTTTTTSPAQAPGAVVTPAAPSQ